jgi:ATP-dependent DNA ligase
VDNSGGETGFIDQLPELLATWNGSIGTNGRRCLATLQTAASSFRIAAITPTLSGEDLMKRTLDERRTLLRRTMRQLAEPIRFSETFDTSPGDMIAVVRENGLEGVVAKRRDSHYEPGSRSGAWVKLRVNRRQNFVIGGYTPREQNFDSILVGYYKGHDLKYAASIRAGFTPASRRQVSARFTKLETVDCPFSNLPDATKGRWGAGITAEKMAQCHWLKPRIVVAIDFLEWTLENRLRHPSFVALSKDMPTKNISIARSQQKNP